MAQRGSATVEWTALVLVVACVLGAAIVAVPGALHAPGFARAIRCAVLGGCHGEDARLEAVYGAEAAAFVRAFAPGIVYERGTSTLPVDYRHCRSHHCSDAPADAREAWRSARGRPATVFTRVVDRRGVGGALYIQYWLYYPDSTYLGPARALGRAPVIAHTPLGALSRRAAGHHADDWESYQVRVDSGGMVTARASAHHGYAGLRRWPNLNELPREPSVTVPGVGRITRRRGGAWTPVTGWTRVSRGSHAGHLVPGAGDERRTISDGLVLVPVESLSTAERGERFAVTPPWRKPVYADPARTDT